MKNVNVVVVIVHIKEIEIMDDLYSSELIIPEVIHIISDTLQYPSESIKFNPISKVAVIELKRSRHITICTHQLETLKKRFNCDDIIISSPYRCVIELKFWVNKEEQCCWKCCNG